MEGRLLERYASELGHLRSSAAEFAREYPKIAGRLGLGDFECADPYVERLLEGFAFLAARIQLRFEDGFPALAGALLDVASPGLLAPVPAMAVACCEPDPASPGLAGGMRLPRGTPLLGASSEATAPEFRTAADLDLLPLAIEDVTYQTRDFVLRDPPPGITWRSALRLRLRPLIATGWERCTADSLRVQVLGGDETAWSLLELLHTSTRAVVIDAADGRRLAQLDGTNLVLPGLGDDEAMLPVSPQAQPGTRLLQEYFAFPERFSAFALHNIGAALRACQGRPIEITLLLGDRRESLVRLVESARLALNTVPVINLFPRRCERVPTDGRQHEYHLIANRTRPNDFEVHSVLAVEVCDAGGATLFQAAPFSSLVPADEDGARFVAYRRQLGTGPRRSAAYHGSEIFVALTGDEYAKRQHELRQVGAQVLCTSRDLVTTMPVGRPEGDFTVPSGLPVRRIRCIAGPTAPIAAPAGQELAWQAVSSLRQAQLAIAARDGGEAAAALRGLMGLHARGKPGSTANQAQALLRCTVGETVRRVPGTGPISFARGLAIELIFDDQAFRGGSCLPLGHILAEALADQVSVNSFVAVALALQERGALTAWQPRLGRVPCL